MEAEVRALFERYRDCTQRALDGQPDMEATAGLYASDYVAASPLGVMSGRNDQNLREAIEGGFAHYRRIGTRAMQVRAVRMTPLDGMHCVAHVDWRAIYARDDLPETAIDFTVHYLVQIRDDAARVFGWVTGDEQAVLREHGVI